MLAIASRSREAALGALKYLSNSSVMISPTRDAVLPGSFVRVRSVDILNYWQAIVDELQAR